MFKPITAEEARGDSTALDYDTLAALANYGERVLADAVVRSKAALSDAVLAYAYAMAATPWGGVTISLATGRPIDRDSGYAVSTGGGVSMSFAASEDTFRDHVIRVASAAGHYVGVFHDDDKSTIDIDPVYVTDFELDAVAVAVARHSTGGVYDFSTGDAVWPPHLAK